MSLQLANNGGAVTNWLQPSNWRPADCLQQAARGVRWRRVAPSRIRRGHEPPDVVPDVVLMWLFLRLKYR
jgi:hypothetical protein